jgi:uncharacterized lipoprotein YmbA
MLNPLPSQANSSYRHVGLKIGIEAIHTPSFTEKPQLMIYNSFNQVQLEEFHQWAESLDKNIKRVIKTNLNTLLPKIVVEDSPWRIDFNPDYTLQITISEFKIDVLGNSSLRADYTVSKEGQIIKKANNYIKLPKVNVETLIKSMNTNLNHLSQDIAFTFFEQNRKNKRR